MTPSALMHGLGRVLGGATLGVALLAPAALARAPTPPRADQQADEDAAPLPASVQGIVEALSPTSLLLRRADGGAVMVELDEETTYDNDGKAGSISELRTGMAVTVRGEMIDGTLRADSVRYGQLGTRPAEQPR